MSATSLIAIDWGTTSARAYCLDAAGKVVAARCVPLGVLQVQDGCFPEALAILLGDWHDVAAPRLACGMVGSRQGWREAPYVDCPAPLASLAAGIVHTDGRALAIVPGVRTRDSNGIPDVMRGEETQLVGAVDEHEERVLAVLPGTHSKWALVEKGRITDFATYMTGEMYSVLLQHSILGRLAQPAGAEPGSAFALGVTRGLGAGGLNHDLFGARTLVLTGELATHDVSDWLSGLLIGREVRNARLWAHRQGCDGARVRLVGADALLARYATAMTQAGINVEQAPTEAAAFGLWRIAQHATLVSNSLH
ncbi:MAG: 2-dehydro-3-deoxygalactonokinase [Betaproteobacteria bacterium]